jgi:uncharacterized membrane protein
MFQRNESTLDRVVRVVVGGGLLAVSFAALGLASAKPLGIVFGVVGAVLLFTAATGSCLLYRLVGVNTAKSK